MKSENKTVDISILPEEEQNLVTALVNKCYENVKYKEKFKLKTKVRKPKFRDKYWYIDIVNDRAIRDAWLNTMVDNGRWALGNVFNTKEDAKFAIEKQKVKIELQRYADEHNNPKKEEWDGINNHYLICYDLILMKICIVDYASYMDGSVTYFTSSAIARDAIKKVGEKRILKYLFGVDCEVNS